MLLKMMENFIHNCFEKNHCFFNSDNNMHLAVESLVDINNIIISSNNIAVTKVNVQACGYDKICTYMDKDLIEDKLYELIDQFNERKINSRNLHFALLNNVSSFYDANRRILVTLFVTNLR